MKVIRFTNTDGSIGIISPAVVKDVPDGLDYEIVDRSSIFNDRSFRNAWVYNKDIIPQKVSVNVTLARDVSLVRVRANRDKQLVALDKEYLIASRTGADTSLLDAKRQTLLDATNQLKALDLNNDGIVSVEEAADLLLPLEIIA